MRRKGLSLRIISRRLKISKSTLSVWFKHDAASNRLKKKLTKANQRRARYSLYQWSLRMRARRQKTYQQIRTIARRDYLLLRQQPDFLIGLMAYWSEGDRQGINGNIRIANSDPFLIKFFYHFICRYLSEVAAKARMYLILYPDNQDRYCRHIWSRQVGLPLAKFFKSSYIIGRSKRRRVVYGIGSLTIANRLYKEKLLEWLACFRKEVSKMRV